MTDLEIIKRCARAMGLEICFVNKEDQEISVVGQDGFDCLYDPLHDDAQAMALVKRFGLHLSFEPEEGNADVMLWTVEHRLDPKYGGISFYSDLDLNRAICECVARLQEVKQHGE